ncbi:MAG: Pvc16 family protein [Candidatus Nanopelagicales bacterium]
MIHEVDSALRALIERDAPGTRDVEIVFDAPTREWAGRRNSPTIDVYLYDIREDLRRRERGMHNVYDESKIIVSRHLPPRHFKLSYLVTAWTQRPEDEHRLLSSLLTCFLRYDALPSEVLTGPLTELGLPIPVTIALPPPEDRAFADVWSALGGELKPSIDLVVTTPLDTGQQFHTGPPVERPPHVSLGGSRGWPSRETKSRSGVVAEPDRAHEQEAAAGPGEESRPASASADTPTHGRRGTRRTSEGAAPAARSDRGSRPASQDPDRPDGASGRESGTVEPDVWEIASGWADAMPDPGSAGSTEPLPGRAAGRPPGAWAAATVPAAEPPEPTEGGELSDPASGAKATGRRTAGGAKKTQTGSAKAAGRPGPRVAITRTRPKKGT